VNAADQPMNSLIRILVAGALFLCPVLAQTLAPEIAPLAAKYDADIKSLDASRTAAVSRIQQLYLADLNAAEKTATAAGKLSEVAAILKAREAVSTQSAVLAPPTGMSKAQEKRHADYFASLATVDREFAPRYEAKIVEYLRNLAMVRSRMAATSPAIGQIDAIKTALMGVAATGGYHQLGNKIFDNTEWLWDGSPEHVWQFLPGGKIVKDDGDRRLGWKILGPETFMITTSGKDWCSFTFNVNKMEAEGALVSNAKDRKRLVFKGKASK
jgi:hypothetical protein